MPRLLSLLLVLGLLGSCSGPRTLGSSLSSSPPSLRLLSVSPQSSTSVLRELRPGEKAHSQERIVLRIQTNQATPLYVVWYASAGESELLYPRSQPSQRAPPPVPLLDVLLPSLDQLHGGQSEVSLFVVASDLPIDPLLCALLHLRCQAEPSADASRGEETSKKARKSKVDKKDKEVASDKDERSAQPRISKPKDDRGGAGAPAEFWAVPILPGIGAAVTVVPVFLKYELSE